MWIYMHKMWSFRNRVDFFSQINKKTGEKEDYHEQELC